ncbi:MAG: hypothetical protein ACE5F6_15090 [Anaerolineae bacterium]
MAVEEAADRVEALQREIPELEEELRDQASVITERWDEALEEFEEMPVTPRRSDINVDLFALAWKPHWRITYQDRGGITRTELTPAY